METNNGIEAQNKVLKYSYLPHRKNINLSHLSDIIVNSFLPDSYEKYLFQNYKMNPTYRKYRDQIPPYLHGRPPALIEHCLHRQQKAKHKFTANSIISSDDVNGLFTICGESGTKHHVDFGKSSGQPSCTCGDWCKTHFPCKHFFAIFMYKSTWDWNSLPKSYLEGPYLSTDINALVHASLLTSSVGRQTDATTESDEQTHFLTDELLDEQTHSLMDEVSLTDELLDEQPHLESQDNARAQRCVTSKESDLRLRVSIVMYWIDKVACYIMYS